MTKLEQCVTVVCNRFIDEGLGQKSIKFMWYKQGRTFYSKLEPRPLPVDSRQGKPRPGGGLYLRHQETPRRTSRSLTAAADVAAAVLSSDRIHDTPLADKIRPVGHSVECSSLELSPSAYLSALIFELSAG
ncbi:hypothetical protein RRG08_037954 [Elysia crispata]|uniref:Uncharacterized protein n=1 Tax=Elysia crispata TaxID=231223 RepID=A0AAE1ACD9_9GAST|nr:hypothetical protein RRG08_037954 [Elysia crispata]